MGTTLTSFYSVVFWVRMSNSIRGSFYIYLVLADWSCLYKETILPEVCIFSSFFLIDRAIVDSYIDRTSELRRKGYTGRRLGPKQMTTDTAVRVTRMIAQERSKYWLTMGSLEQSIDRYVIVPLDKIAYVDTPELRINEYESTEMPFRYVTNSEGKPIMPEVRVHLDSL